jgi:hypothetical protein
MTRGPWKWHRTNEKTRPTVAAFLWALHDLGGDVTDENGRVPAIIARHAAEMGMPLNPSLNRSQVIGSLDNGYPGTIEREMDDKKTYRITLLLADDEMPPRPQPVVTEPQPEPEPVPPTLALVPEPDMPAVVADASDDPVNALLEIQKLAMGAVMGLTRQRSEPDTDTDRERLAATLEENQRLRDKVRDLSETVAAKAKEIDALRKALTTAQANMAAIQKASADAPERERQLANLRATERFMQAKPGTR